MRVVPLTVRAGPGPPGCRCCPVPCLLHASIPPAADQKLLPKVKAAHQQQLGVMGLAYPRGTKPPLPTPVGGELLDGRAMAWDVEDPRGGALADEPACAVKRTPLSRRVRIWKENGRYRWACTCNRHQIGVAIDIAVERLLRLFDKPMLNISVDFDRLDFAIGTCSAYEVAYCAIQFPFHVDQISC